MTDSLLRPVLSAMVCCVVSSVPPPAPAAQPARVVFDFESGDLQGWKVVEGRFGKIVTDRATFHNHPNVKYNKQGKYYLSTVELPDDRPDDRMTGIVESPVFELAGPEMSLSISGGSHADTYVALCTLDGKEILQARGKLTETMHRVTWKAPQLVGKKAFLRIVDRNRGGWGHVDLDNFTARGRIDPDATRKHFAEVESRAARRRIAAWREGNQWTALRLAIEDLSAAFPKEYRGYIDRFSKHERRLVEMEAALATGDVAARKGPVRKEVVQLLDELEAFRREALIANPLVSGQPILFVVRHQYRSHYHAIDTLFHTGEFNPDRNIPHSDLFQGGGTMKTIDLATGDRVTTLIDLPRGVVRDPDLHFSGKRIVFAMRRNAGEDYHVWEIDADGSGLRQLTSAAGVCDFDPIYLPDDGIAFSSTREPKYNMCSRDIAANLHRMDADGANVHQITKNTLFDNHSRLLPDGRILYARWEYVDRNFGDAHGLWTVNPDGTNQAVYWGNNTAVPGAVFNAHPLPGTQQILCIFGPHHDRLWGALAIVDRRLGIDGRKPVIRTWPADAAGAVRSGGAFDCDLHARTVALKYEDPWPLSEKYFLCSRMTGNAEQTGIYLVDVFGNELLLHTEGPGCYDPMPVKPRSRPPVIPPRRKFDGQQGYFYVADVYRGTQMQGVQRGTVKSLRVVESPEKRHWARGAWFGQGYTAPGMNWHGLENKRILGTVPVEQDGSAYFAVPADTFVYFQLLDRDGMMIQSMRSGTVAQSGELTGCVGCHDGRRAAPPRIAGETPLALKRPPSKLGGWYGPPRPFGYMAEVQPVFDKHCVSCHDYGTEAGKKVNLAADRDLTFNTAYNELWRRGYIKCIGAGPAEVRAPYSWGSYASKLVEVVRHPKIPEHQQIKLSPEESDRLVTWIDLNGVYYPTYACAYPESLTGRCPLNDRQLARLSQLTGVPFDSRRSYNGNRGPQVCFQRPELSPCLEKSSDESDPRYRQALEIIRAGRESLAARPRADMAGFRPCEADRRREEKYALRRRAESRNREAIRHGRRVYDSDP